MLLMTFGLSIFAIVQRNHVTIGLVLLNWMLIADSIAILVVGVYVWFFTLEIRNNFHKVWLRSTPDIRTQIQDKVRRALPSHMRAGWIPTRILSTNGHLTRRDLI